MLWDTATAVCIVPLLVFIRYVYALQTALCMPACSCVAACTALISEFGSDRTAAEGTQDNVVHTFNQTAVVKFQLSSSAQARAPLAQQNLVLPRTYCGYPQLQ